MTDNEAQEGDRCNQEGCGGTFQFAKVVNCSCHLYAPCSSCVNAGLMCDTCGHETAPYEEPEPYIPPKREHVDRSDCFTKTHTDNPYNSTPFTRCCGVAAIDTSRCPSCNATITGHDDGLAERRRWANGGCLMCGKPLPKKQLGEPGTCYC